MADGSPRPTQAQLLEQVIAGQAKVGQQVEEIFRRLAKAEAVGSDARDTAREVVTILREQDTAARLAEMRSETRNHVDGLRHDVVAANTRLREDVEELTGRVAALEAERAKVVGVASFFGWLAKTWPVFLAIAAAWWAGVEKSGG